MAVNLRQFLRCVTIGAILSAAVPSGAHSQEEALADVFGNATEFSFFWTQVGSPRGDFRPERSAGAAGLGFELGVPIPGGLTRTLHAKTKRSSKPSGTTCKARYSRGELSQGEPCADTTVVMVKRIRSTHDTSYEEQLKIDKFSWEIPVLTLALAGGFSQAGAFVSRRPQNDIRVSVREIPSVSAYVNYNPRLPVVGRAIGAHLGARTGIISLVGGRAFGADASARLSGETFQVGPVAGIVTRIRSVNAFAEGAYLWRHFNSVDWDSIEGLPNLPRSIDFSGPSLRIGLEFRFRSPDEKTEGTDPDSGGGAISHER